MQEDISRLRRKLETTKKPDMVPNCDEILMEEIKDYKVSSCLYPLPSLVKMPRISVFDISCLYSGTVTLSCIEGTTFSF